MIVVALVGADRLPVHQDVERAGAGRGFGRAVRARQRAALRDQRLHQHLYRPDARADQGPARARRRDFSIVGFGGETNSGFAIWALQGLGRARPLAERRSSRTSRRGCRRWPASQAFVFAPPSLPGAGGGLPISLVIQSTGDPSQVFEVAEQVKQKAQASRQVHRRPELAGLRRAAGDDHRSTATARRRSTCRSATSARRSACSSAAARSRSSTAIPTATTSSCRCRSEYRHNPEQLGNFFVRSVTGEMVPLSAVVTDLDQRLAGGDRAVQPAQLGDHLGPAAARRHHRRRPRRPSRTSPGRCCRTASSSTIPASRGSRSSRATRSSSPSRSPSSSSIWCSPPSSRASAIR